MRHQNCSPVPHQVPTSRVGKKKRKGKMAVTSHYLLVVLKMSQGKLSEAWGGILVNLVFAVSSLGNGMLFSDLL